MLVLVTLLNVIPLPTDGDVESCDADEHESRYVVVAWFGSLLDRTRVSTNGVDALDPVGGLHTITIDDPELLAKFEIGSDPDEIENHDPIENDPDCMTLSDPTPLLLT